MTANNIEGIMRIFIDLKVSVDDMKDWTPERITAFFTGLAMVRRAADDPDAFVLDEESQLIAAGYKPKFIKRRI